MYLLHVCAKVFLGEWSGVKRGECGFEGCSFHHTSTLPIDESSHHLHGLTAVIGIIERFNNLPLANRHLTRIDTQPLASYNRSPTTRVEHTSNRALLNDAALQGNSPRELR